MGRDSSVGTATSYGLDGPGIESRWERGSPDSFRLALWSTQPPVQCVPVVMRPVRIVNHPPQSCAEVKERVAQHLYSHSGPSWQVTGWSLPLYFWLNTSYGLYSSLLHKFLPLTLENTCFHCKRGFKYGLYFLVCASPPWEADSH